jgi:hypothetical protein
MYQVPYALQSFHVSAREVVAICLFGIILYGLLKAFDWDLYRSHASATVVVFLIVLHGITGVKYTYALNLHTPFELALFYSLTASASLLLIFHKRKRSIRLLVTVITVGVIIFLAAFFFEI